MLLSIIEVEWDQRAMKRKYIMLFFFVLYLSMKANGIAIIHLVWLHVVDEESSLPIMQLLFGLLLAEITPKLSGQQETSI